MLKKGELTTQQIVILIVLIASFAVILFFIFRLNIGQETEDEICHNSVVTRGKSILPTDTFPLKCKRSYVCLSSDGTCEKMVKPDLRKVQTEEEVYEVLADELADCWWMFGEGKINYAGSDLTSELYCSICSQIAFDDSIKEVFGGDSFSEEFFQNYLLSKEVHKGETYAEYFGTKELIEYYQGDYKQIKLDNQYYAMMGISGDVSALGWAVAGGIVAAAIAFSPVGPVAGIVTGIIIAGGGAAAGGYLVAPVIEGLSGNDFIPPSLMEANSPEFDALECETISTLS